MAKRNIYSKSTIDEAIRLYEAGVSPTEIQHRLNIKEGSLYWWLKKQGVKRRVRVFPKHIIDEAKKLYESGAGPTEIERKLNFPKYSQQYWFKKMGLTMRTLKESQRLRLERGIGIQVYDKASNWHGGHTKTEQGYILVKLPPNDFFLQMANSNGYIFQHRLVMAKYLKRNLLPWEVIHHKNGIKEDNRLENLELLPASYKHTSTIRMQTHIKKLEQKLVKLEGELEEQQKQIRLLQWRAKEECHA